VRDRTRKMLLTIAILGVVGIVAGVGTFSAFSSTTSNDANTFAAGSVVLTDNDSGSAMYQVTNAKPGDSATACITVTYSGSLDSNVRLYTASSIGSLGSHLNLKVTPGTGTVSFGSSCSNFTADSGGAIYDGTLANFASSHSAFGNGLALENASGNTTWSQNNAVVYQFEITLPSSNTTAQGLTTNSHSFTWEAQNT
jgi:predicted ribosomally synthesized peptide with SipW-like signal peptide